jgi:hypothetical protein
LSILNGIQTNIYVFVGIFALYGIYAAATEGVSGVDQQYFERKDTATAIGTYSAFQSFFTMLASSMAGLICTSLARTPLF